VRRQISQQVLEPGFDALEVFGAFLQGPGVDQDLA